MIRRAEKIIRLPSRLRRTRPRGAESHGGWPFPNARELDF